MTELQSPLDQQVALAGDAQALVTRKSPRFTCGIFLMAGSFLVYPSYPVILLWLPLSTSAKAAASVAVWLGSWGSFSLGAYLAGPQGYLWFKGTWQRVLARRGQFLTRR